MKKSSHPFVRFLNLYRALNQQPYSEESTKPLHAEAIAILAFISSQNELGCHTSITRVVQQNDFGAPPTIHRRIKELLELRFLAFYDGPDKRHRLLKSTQAGEAYLKSCTELMLAAIKEGV